MSDLRTSNSRGTLQAGRMYSLRWLAGYTYFSRCVSYLAPCFWLADYSADYEPGDLSKELDTRVKQKVAEFAGKDSYEFGEFIATNTLA